jgi:YD repeat-containing protein
MKRKFRYLAVCLPLVSGCAALIAQSGQDLSQIASKEEMRAALGQPVAKGVVDGCPYEDFRTRKVIANRLFGDGDGYVIWWVTTLGTIDLIGVPSELCGLAGRTLFGQTIRVTYDKNGNVQDVIRNGSPVTDRPQRSTSENSRDVQPVSATTGSGPSMAR